MKFHSEPRVPKLGDSPSKLGVCFDIETGPEPLGRVKEMLPPVKVPATYKKEEAIEAYRKKASKDAIAKAPLEATTGRVLAIGYAFSDDPEVYVIADMGEKSILEAFWALYRPVFSATWIGFNSNSFDWPFLLRRSMKYGITFPFEFYQPVKWRKNFVDLMEVYACGEFQKRISLDRLARFLGVGEKAGSGEHFHELWKTDREAALDYLENDIRLTKAIWEKIGW
tara:strand:+ start:19574 stop:20248 length:675 start_codon:yes stop_codon:yes gene_type:complete